jgi:hypothetical protein
MALQGQEEIYVSNNSVSQIGGNTYVASTGTNNYLWNDKNNNGIVDTGDLFVRTRQSDASVTTYVVGQDEGMHAYGDPHLDNFALTAEGKTAVIASLGAAFADVKDGVVNNAALLGNIDAALATHGTRDNIMDFHSNIAVSLTDGTRVEFDVARIGALAVTDNLDVDVVDSQGNKRTVTFNEIWAGNGGAGQSGVIETTDNVAQQAVKDSNSVYLFHEYKDANVMHGTMMFGTTAGTKNFAHVVDADGNLKVEHGRLTLESIRFYDTVLRGHETLTQAMQLGGYDEENYEQEELAWAQQGYRAVAPHPWARPTEATGNDS